MVCKVECVIVNAYVLYIVSASIYYWTNKCHITGKEVVVPEHIVHYHHVLCVLKP